MNSQITTAVLVVCSVSRIPAPASNAVPVEKRANVAQALWLSFLEDCGVKPEYPAVCQAVKSTAKRHFAQNNVEAIEIPNGTGYDLAKVPLYIREELVLIVRKAIEPFHYLS